MHGKWWRKGSSSPGKHIWMYKRILFSIKEILIFSRQILRFHYLTPRFTIPSNKKCGLSIDQDRLIKSNLHTASMATFLFEIFILNSQHDVLMNLEKLKREF